VIKTKIVIMINPTTVTENVEWAIILFIVKSKDNGIERTNIPSINE